MEESHGRTAKGSRRREQIVAAAIAILGREGYSGTSLQAVADEAGVQKRMVIYYFGSREGLILQVVEGIGERFFAELEEALADPLDPLAALDAALDVVWRTISVDRALHGAYYGLIAESVSDPAIAASLAALRDRGRALAARLLDDLEAAGYRLTMQRELLILMASAAVHGLGIELLEHGVTPELERAVALARAGLPLLLFE